MERFQSRVILRRYRCGHDQAQGFHRPSEQLRVPGIAFLLSQLGYYSSRRWKARLAPLGLDPRHVMVLRRLADAEGRSQQALGDALQILPSRMVALVDALEQRGLLMRRPSPSDRRVDPAPHRGGSATARRNQEISVEHELGAHVAASSPPSVSSLPHAAQPACCRAGTGRRGPPGGRRPRSRRPLTTPAAQGIRPILTIRLLGILGGSAGNGRGLANRQAAWPVRETISASSHGPSHRFPCSCHTTRSVLPDWWTPPARRFRPPRNRHVRRPRRSDAFAVDPATAPAPWSPRRRSRTPSRPGRDRFR